MLVLFVQFISPCLDSGVRCWLLSAVFSAFFCLFAAFLAALFAFLLSFFCLDFSSLSSVFCSCGLVGGGGGGGGDGGGGDFGGGGGVCFLVCSVVGVVFGLFEFF